MKDMIELGKELERKDNKIEKLEKEIEMLKQPPIPANPSFNSKAALFSKYMKKDPKNIIKFITIVFIIYVVIQFLMNII